MDVSCILIEIKPGSRARVEEWAAHITANKEEAIATLRNEGVTVESFFFLTINSVDHLICYMRAKSMEKAHDVVEKSLSEIDAYHKKFQRDTWVSGNRAELLIDLSRISNECSAA
jgi:hypothetical protein